MEKRKIFRFLEIPQRGNQRQRYAYVQRFVKGIRPKIQVFGLNNGLRIKL